jgi:hypothetical protein
MHIERKRQDDRSRGLLSKKERGEGKGRGRKRREERPAGKTPRTCVHKEKK